MTKNAPRTSVGAACGGGLLGLICLASPASAHTDLTVVNFGGSAARAQMLALIRPWEKETGLEAEMVEYNGGIEEIRRQVEAANVTWDVVDMEYSDLIQACDQGLLEPLDQSILPSGLDGVTASEDFREGALHECGVGNIVWATVYAYANASYADDRPESIGDFFDTRKFPGKRGVRRDPRGLLEWALMADGVPAGEVYTTLATTEGLDQAFDRVEDLLGDIVWWERGPQPAQLLADGEVTMSMAWNGRLYRPIVEQGADYTIVWDGQIWEYDLYAIPKDTERLENALDFVHFATSTEALVDWTKYISYGPARESANALVDEAIKPMLPTTEANMASALQYDSQWWAENLDQIRTRFGLLLDSHTAAAESREQRF